MRNYQENIQPNLITLFVCCVQWNENIGQENLKGKKKKYTRPVFDTFWRKFIVASNLWDGHYIRLPWLAVFQKKIQNFLTIMVESFVEHIKGVIAIFPMILTIIFIFLIRKCRMLLKYASLQCFLSSLWP